MPKIQHPRNEIIAVIGETIRLKHDTLGPALLSDITAELTRENPQYHQMARMARRNPWKFQHMRMPPRTVQSIFEDDETVYVPRGCRVLVTELAEKYGQPIRWIDERIFFDRDTGMKLNDDVELFPYQKAHLAPVVFGEEGIVWMPCSGGKTVMGVAIIMTLAQPTIIFVHTMELMEGWLRELRDKATVPGGLGQWGGGKKVRGSVTVAMVQTLSRMPGPAVRELMDGFGCAILDECHHCPANTFLDVMNVSKARYRYGFTATRERKDGLHFLMHDTIGPVVATIDDSDLQAAGRSQPIEVTEVLTTFNTHYTADQWTQLIAAIVADEDRNILIIENVVQSWNDGHFSLVLSDRVGHCRELARRLESRGMSVGLLVGSVPKLQRTQLVQAARDNLLDAVVATSLADEALDIPPLSCVHLTMPSANEGKLQQRIGRIKRPLEGKPTSLVYDYVDVHHPTCARMYSSRRRYYRQWGFTARTKSVRN